MPLNDSLITLSLKNGTAQTIDIKSSFLFIGIITFSSSSPVVIT